MKNLITIGFFAIIISVCHGQTNFEIANTPLRTPFSEIIDPASTLPEYPRPQIEREEWMNLNGLWDYTIQSVDFEPLQGLTKESSWTTGRIPEEWRGKILVPFAIDAPLSGVGQILRHDEVLWYHRNVKIPASWKNRRILLNFQASDWETSVYVNGEKVGQHRGGYDPFSFDITEYLSENENQLNVCVWDATENQSQAIGKQIMPENRQGFRYQPTGGIWQTVWIEPVSDNAIQSIRIIPDYNHSLVQLEVKASNKESKVNVIVFDKGLPIAEQSGITGKLISIPLNNFKAWSPDDPFLYTMKIELGEKGLEVDEVNSYFGMRKIEVKTADDGNKRIFLNDEPVFQYGPLDQGYWPEGVLTPPSEEAIKFDLEYLKRIGCNMVRVHIKTHPERWYYQADKLGLLVWQDMICMPKYGQTVDDLAAEQWFIEFRSMVDWLYNHPSVVSWVIFNEGWGQHNTEFYANWIKGYDPNRIINAVSGWNDKPVGDVMDVHDYTFYPRNNAADYKLDGTRALVIGEAAGINLAIPGHTWYSETNPPHQKRHNNFIPADKYSFKEEAGRHTYGSPDVFEVAYRKFIETIRLLNSGSGCNALVYTQLSDVEHELNGYLSYDRKVSKIDPAVMREINLSLYDPPELTAIVPFGASWELHPEGSVSRNIGLPAGDSNDFMKVKEVISSPYRIEKSFVLNSLPSKAAVAIKGFTNGDIFINGSLFRKTTTQASFFDREPTGFGEPGIDFYPVYEEEMNLLLLGENHIVIQTRETADIDLLDAAVFIYD